MSFYLAVDAGGTKTDYLLADETGVLGRVRGGTIKRMRADAATTQMHLETALGELAEATGVGMREVSRTCVGTAGETVALVADWLRQAFAAQVSGDLVLVGDVEIALDAAFRGAPGILVLAGTGSNVAGRMHDGRLTGVGGWGPALADQGSGHRIGHEALRAIFLARDEGRTTTLLDAVLEFWGLGTLDELVGHANRLPPPDFSRLTTLVAREAATGDPVAGEVLRQQGEELAHLVCLAVRRLVAGSPEAGWMPGIAFAGSILEKVMPVREALVGAVRREFPGIRALDGVVDPVDGALWRARGGGLLRAG